MVYGVAVGDAITMGVAVAAGVGVSETAAWVSFVGTAVPLSGTSGHANKFTGKSVHVLPSVQMLRVSGVFSGALHKTTCLPLFTSTVEHVTSFVAVVDVFVVVKETTLNVAVSGSTSNAWAKVSTQN